MYEANPMAMLVEQADGGAVNGGGRMLKIQPEALHQRVSVFLGSCDEITRIEALHLAG